MEIKIDGEFGSDAFRTCKFSLFTNCIIIILGFDLLFQRQSELKNGKNVQSVFDLFLVFFFIYDAPHQCDTKERNNLLS